MTGSLKICSSVITFPLNSFSIEQCVILTMVLQLALVWGQGHIYPLYKSGNSLNSGMICISGAREYCG